jgi:probable HAF family extracellular repeat protein
MRPFLPVRAPSARAGFLPRLFALTAALAALVATAAPRTGVAARQSGGDGVTPLAVGGPPPPLYVIFPLNSGVAAFANGVSDAQRVVGGVQPSLGADVHASVWAGFTPVDLGTLGGSASSAYGINASDHVVGYAYTATNEQHAFLWFNDVMQDLHGGPQSSGNAINAAGDVAGSATFSSRHGPVVHAALWHHNKLRNLGTLGGDQGSANAINDRGQVAGTDATAQGDFHGFRWSNGKMRDLGTLGGNISVAFGINHRGDVAGGADIGQRDAHGNPIRHAFLWHNGAMLDLGTMGGLNSTADGINDAGLVVGISEDSNGRPVAFLWQDGAMFDLSGLAPTNPGYHLTRASAVSKSGQISAEGFDPNDPNTQLAFLLIRCADDVTGQAQFKVDALEQISPGLWRQKMHIRNISGHDIAGPISFVADLLEPPDVVMNHDGVTACLPPLGSPYLTFRGPLKRNQTQTLTLTFSTSIGPPIIYGARLLAGPNRR